MINKLDNNQISEGALNTRKGVLGAAQTVNQSTSPQTNTQNRPDNAQDALLQSERPANPSFQAVHLAIMYSPIKEVHYGTDTNNIEIIGSQETFLV